MFGISEQLILEQSDDIFGVSPNSWESSPWKHFSLVSDEEIISLSHGKVYVCSDSVLCVGKVNQNPISFGNDSWNGSKIHHNTEHWTIDGEPMEFESNVFPRFSTLELVPKVHEQKWANPYNSNDELSSCRCSMTSHGVLKTMNGNAMLTPTSFPCMQEDFHQENGHSSDLDQKRSGILLMLTNHNEKGTDWKIINTLLPR